MTLVTDDEDPVKQQVPLLVYGQVESDITITPVLEFGELRPGETKTKTLVVRGKRPITIEKIEREKADDAFRVRLPEDAKPVHALPITLITPDEAGPFDELFTVTIAGRSEPVTFRAQGKILATTPNPVSSSAN